jgi:hypothetical protein
LKSIHCFDWYGKKLIGKTYENIKMMHKNPGVNVIKLFPSSLMTRPSKLEGLSLETLSSQVLEFVGKARVNPIRRPFRCFLLGQAPGVASKC